MLLIGNVSLRIHNVVPRNIKMYHFIESLIRENDLFKLRSVIDSLHIVCGVCCAVVEVYKVSCYPCLVGCLKTANL